MDIIPEAPAVTPVFQICAAFSYAAIKYYKIKYCFTAVARCYSGNIVAELPL
jgi:hypothetical protein